MWGCGGMGSHEIKHVDEVVLSYFIVLLAIFIPPTDWFMISVANHDCSENTTSHLWIEHICHSP